MQWHTCTPSVGHCKKLVQYANTEEEGPGRADHTWLHLLKRSLRKWIQGQSPTGICLSLVTAINANLQILQPYKKELEGICQVYIYPLYIHLGLIPRPSWGIWLWGNVYLTSPQVLSTHYQLSSLVFTYCKRPKTGGSGTWASSECVCRTVGLGVR